MFVRFLLENKTSKQPHQSPPEGQLGTGQLGRLPICPSGGMISFSIFVVAAVTAMYVFYKKVSATYYN